MADHDSKIDPYDVGALEKSLNDSATRVSAIWVSFLLFSLYLLTAAANVTHRQLFLGDAIKLPVLNIELPLLGFFFLAPVLFIILHFYVLLQVILLARTAAAYNEAIDKNVADASDNTRIRQRLANTLFAQIFAGSPHERGGWLGGSLKAMAWITLVIAPILILLTFQFMFLPYHSHPVTWAHRLLILIELAGAFWLWPRVLDSRPGLRRSAVARRPKIFFRLRGASTISHRLRALRRVALALIALSLFAIVSLSLATFPGEPHINVATGQDLSSVQCDRWFSHRFDRLNLAQEEFVDREKLAKLEKTTPSGSGWTRSFRGRDFACADLSSTDLRRVDLADSQLSFARLNFANLQNATLSRANLEAASPDFARLEGASLGRALLRGASLAFTRLQGAILWEAQLQGAFLMGARLQGAYLRAAELQGAVLDAAELQGAFLGNAELQGASLLAARLDGAFFEEAQLQGADFTKSVMAGADFSGAWIWRAGGASCQDARVKNHQSIPVIQVRHGPGIPAKPDEIEKFIVRYVTQIPGEKNLAGLAGAVGSAQERSERRLRSGLLARWDDTGQIARVWSDCEETTKKRSTEEFDRALILRLRHLACEAPEARKAVAVGIIRNWLRSDRPSLSIRLARNLLGQEGGACAVFEELDEQSKEDLRGTISRAPVDSPG